MEEAPILAKTSTPPKKRPSLKAIRRRREDTCDRPSYYSPAAWHSQGVGPTIFTRAKRMAPQSSPAPSNGTSPTTSSPSDGPQSRKQLLFNNPSTPPSTTTTTTATRPRATTPSTSIPSATTTTTSPPSTSRVSAVHPLPRPRKQGLSRGALISKSASYYPSNVWENRLRGRGSLLTRARRQGIRAINRSTPSKSFAAASTTTVSQAAHHSTTSDGHESSPVSHPSDDFVDDYDYDDRMPSTVVRLRVIEEAPTATIIKSSGSPPQAPLPKKTSKPKTLKPKTAPQPSVIAKLRSKPHRDIVPVPSSNTTAVPPSGPKGKRQRASTRVDAPPSPVAVESPSALPDLIPLQSMMDLDVIPDQEDTPATVPEPIQAQPSLSRNTIASPSSRLASIPEEQPPVNEPVIVQHASSVVPDPPSVSQHGGHTSTTTAPRDLVEAQDAQGNAIWTPRSSLPVAPAVLATGTSTVQRNGTTTWSSAAASSRREEPTSAPASRPSRQARTGATPQGPASQPTRQTRSSAAPAARARATPGPSQATGANRTALAQRQATQPRSTTQQNNKSRNSTTTSSGTAAAVAVNNSTDNDNDSDEDVTVTQDPASPRHRLFLSLVLSARCLSQQSTPSLNTSSIHTAQTAWP